MIIVDTTVWIDYLNGVYTWQTDWLDAQLPRQRLGLTDLILAEVLQGVRDERDAEETRRELEKLEMLTMGGVELAVTAAGHYWILRRRGRTIRKTIDTLIATFCMMNDHVLLHNDRDYDAFEQVLGLRVIHP